MRFVKTAAAVLSLIGVCGGDAAVAQPCSEGDASSFTADDLHDLRSFSDAMAIVEAVKEEIPPPPSGPEGWAGLIGRKVKVRVERVLWNRPNAPAPPATFRFSDWGWVGELGDPVPARVCGGTRMEVGRRYLAPIARLRGGVWYPFLEARLALYGDLVVGGVDAEEPNVAHHALAGRTIDEAVGLLARTKPYRAVVRQPRGDPGQRYQAASRDHFRLWRAGPEISVTVAAGTTTRWRWELHLRRPRPGRMCLGMRLRGLWSEAGPRNERCARGVANGAITLNTLPGPGGGAFAYGLAGRKVASVRVRFGDGRWSSVGTLPMPRPGLQRFWVAASENDCARVRVRAFAYPSRLLDEHRSPAGSSPCVRTVTQRQAQLG